MDTLHFIINTTADDFATWLKANWHPPPDCDLYRQPLREKRLQRHSASVRSLAADAAFVVGQPEQETAYFLRDYIRFVLLPLAHDRLEVQIDFPQRAGKEWDYIAEVLEDIGLRWPEAKSLLQDGKIQGAIALEKQESQVPGWTTEQEQEFLAAHQAGFRYEEMERNLWGTERTLRRAARRLGLPKRKPGPKRQFRPFRPKS